MPLKKGDMMNRRKKVKIFFIFLVGLIFIYSFIMIPQGREAFIQAIGFASWDDGDRLLILQEESIKINQQLEQEQEKFSQSLRSYYMGEEGEATVRASASVVDKLKKRAEEIEAKINEIDPFDKN